MSEKTSMFELLNERMEKEDIVKLICNYDNKFNELEEENKFLKLSNPEMNLEHWRVVNENKRKIDNLRKHNKQLKEQLQQKENIIKEIREYIEHENFKRNILVGVSTKKYTRDILNKILEILDKENKQ